MNLATASKKRVLLLALLLVTTGLLPINIYLPALYAMSHTFNTNINSIQLTISVFLFGFAISQLIYGSISDLFGRKKTLVVGLVIFVLGSVLCALATSFHFLLGARLIQGLGAGANCVLARAMLRDAFDGPMLSKMISYLATMWLLTPIIAPAIGGYIQNFFGWPSIFLLLLTTTVLTLIVILKYLPETCCVDRRTGKFSLKDTLQSYLTVSTNPVFLGFLLCSTCIYVFLIIYSISSAHLLQQSLGISLLNFSRLTLATSVAK